MKQFISKRDDEVENAPVAIENLIESSELRTLYDDVTYAREAGRLIRSLRRQAELSQEALAQRLSVSQARISALETGAGRDGPSYALLRRVAAACGFTWPSVSAMAKFIIETNTNVHPAAADASVKELKAWLSQGGESEVGETVHAK